MRTDKPPYATNETAKKLAEPMVTTQRRGCEYWTHGRPGPDTWEHVWEAPCDGTQCDLCIELNEWLDSQHRGEEE